MIRRTIIAVAAAVFAALALTTAPASAGLLTPSGGTCSDDSTKPFAPWLDFADYVLAPDGGFEAGAAGWRGGEVVEGNEPWAVRAAEDRHALALRDGAAVSPTVCVSLAHPTLRFFARNTGASTGALAVEVLVRTRLGLRVALPVGVVADPTDGWAPTPPMLVVANLLELLPGDTTAVRFRFTPVGAGSAWEIDDVYVDPYAKR